MRTLPLLLLLLAANATAAAEAATPEERARRWLALVDTGQYAQAWNQAAPSLRGSGDDAALSERIRRARGGEATVKCRKHLADEPRGDQRQSVLFVTELADGRRFGEKVTLSADAVQIADYRVGPAATDRGPPCADSLTAEPLR